MTEPTEDEILAKAKQFAHYDAGCGMHRTLRRRHRSAIALSTILVALNI
jgi:hypothetical protein